MLTKLGPANRRAQMWTTSRASRKVLSQQKETNLGVDTLYGDRRSPRQCCGDIVHKISFRCGRHRFRLLSSVGAARAKTEACSTPQFGTIPLLLWTSCLRSTNRCLLFLYRRPSPPNNATILVPCLSSSLSSCTCLRPSLRPDSAFFHLANNSPRVSSRQTKLICHYSVTVTCLVHTHGPVTEATIGRDVEQYVGPMHARKNSAVMPFVLIIF